MLTKRLTGRQHEILDVLRQASDKWMDRAEIASATGKSQLSPHDAKLLIELESRGLIEVDEIAVENAPRGKKSVYRIRSGVETH